MAIPSHLAFLPLTPSENTHRFLLPPGHQRILTLLPHAAFSQCRHSVSTAIVSDCSFFAPAFCCRQPFFLFSFPEDRLNTSFHLPSWDVTTSCLTAFFRVSIIIHDTKGNIFIFFSFFDSPSFPYSSTAVEPPHRDRWEDTYSLLSPPPLLNRTTPTQRYKAYHTFTPVSTAQSRLRPHLSLRLLCRPSEFFQFSTHHAASVYTAHSSIAHSSNYRYYSFFICRLSRRYTYTYLHYHYLRFSPSLIIILSARYGISSFFIFPFSRYHNSGLFFRVPYQNFSIFRP